MSILFRLIAVHFFEDAFKLVIDVLQMPFNAVKGSELLLSRIRAGELCASEALAPKAEGTDASPAPIGVAAGIVKCTSSGRTMTPAHLP
jgi:hypothetical protein